MKKIFITLWIVLSGSVLAIAQTNTQVGTGTVNVGVENSNFGYYNGPAAVSGTLGSAFFGAYSGYSNTGSVNAGFGYSSLYHNTSGGDNVAFGNNAMYANTTGEYNVAVGNFALSSGNGGYNVAVGHNSMAAANVSYTTAFGQSSLAALTSGTLNTAFGHAALATTTIGAGNTAFGHNALTANLSGTNNTAIGYGALVSNSSGGNNTATGLQSLNSNFTGSDNTADGYQALYNTTGSQNTALGYGSGPSAANASFTNTTSLGYGAIPTASNQVWLGNSATTTIMTANMFHVSDGRFKKNIREDIVGLGFITKLRPVSYNFQLEQLDRHRGVPDSLMQHEALAEMTAERRTGFIAQEVLQTSLDTKAPFFGVSVPTNQFEIYGLNYSELTVPLVKSVQELKAGSISQQRQSATIDSLLTILERYVSSATRWNVSAGSGIGHGRLQLSGSIPASVLSAKLSVFDSHGSEVKSITVEGRKELLTTIASNDLASGTYYCTIILDGEMTDVKQIEIKN